MPTRCQTARTPCATAQYATARHATQRHATARDIASTSRVGRALGSLSKPWRHDHKKSHALRSGEKARSCAARKNKKRPFYALRPPMGSPQARALLGAKAPKPSAKRLAQRATSLVEEGLSGRMHVRNHLAFAAVPQIPSCRSCRHVGPVGSLGSCKNNAIVGSS